MKKIILIPLLLFIGRAKAQTESSAYDIFYVQETPGIVDAAGNEVWQPNRKFSLSSTWNESLYWIFEGRDTASMLFHKITGEQKICRELRRDGPTIAKEQYMYIRDTANPYLLSYETGKKISLKHTYDGYFRKENDYLFAAYQEYDTALKRYQKRVDILENNAALKPVVEGEYGWSLFLYKEGTVQKIYTDEVPFDAVVFSNGNKHNLYDKNMKRVKRFVVGKARRQDLIKEATRILGYKVNDLYTTLHPDEERNTMVMVEPPPERFLPMIDYSKDKDKVTTVVLKKTDQSVIPLFTTTQRVTIIGRSEVSIEDQKSYDRIARFEVDLATGRCLLPERYRELAGISPVK